MSPQIASIRSRGQRYIRNKLLNADKLALVKLLAKLLISKVENLKSSKKFRYRKMHQIWSDKFFERLTNISQENLGTNKYPFLPSDHEDVVPP